MQSSESGTKGGLLAIGELLIDALTVNFVKDLSEAHTLALHAGGSPANLCRFVQACGGKATLVAAVGNDGLGRMLLKAIGEAGISVDNHSAACWPCHQPYCGGQKQGNS
jgi:fructokinase